MVDFPSFQEVPEKRIDYDVAVKDFREEYCREHGLNTVPKEAQLIFDELWDEKVIAERTYDRGFAAGRESVLKELSVVYHAHDSCDETDCRIYSEQSFDEESCVWKDLRRLLRELRK